MLAAMQGMYGDHITWEDMHVIFEDENGREIRITDPEVVFVGDMSPDIVRGDEDDSGISDYEEAREDLSEDEEETDE
jgi:hypothetical protein